MSDYKVIFYKVVQFYPDAKDAEADSLETLVQRYIDRGWQPYGNLIITKDCWIQAVVK